MEKEKPSTVGGNESEYHHDVKDHRCSSKQKQTAATKTAKKIPCDTTIIFTQTTDRQDIEEMPSGESQFPGYNISHIPGMRMENGDCRIGALWVESRCYLTDIYFKHI